MLNYIYEMLQDPVGDDAWIIGLAGHTTNRESTLETYADLVSRYIEAISMHCRTSRSLERACLVDLAELSRLTL